MARELEDIVAVRLTSFPLLLDKHIPKDEDDLKLEDDMVHGGRARSSPWSSPRIVIIMCLLTLKEGNGDVHSVQ